MENTSNNVIASAAATKPLACGCSDGCDANKLPDEYILQRQPSNQPTALTEIPLLCDLTTSAEITQVDGHVFTMLLVCGFAQVSAKTDELNRINVFPIADGDTGANMKVCLKLPTRNLLLTPSDDIVTAASNLAADTLLNGQGNSGTILSHFFVSLAEEVRSIRKASLSVDAFAACLARAGKKMDAAVPNPVEGTLLSVCRDACAGLEGRGPYSSLEALLTAWNEIAQEELRKTPDKLIVDGVKVLEKAGVVDSGAQGFVYLVEGMKLASAGELPGAMDASMFASSQFMKTDEGTKSIAVDHTVTDSKYRFCTEAVVLLKEGVDAQTVVDVIQKAADEGGIGDSIASVKAPAKDGGNMVKIHMHTNEPDLFFDRLRPYSKDPIFKKEKVEDMLVMRELEHGESFTDLGDAKFTILGMCSYVMPPLHSMTDLHTLPLFVVPATSQEPIDVRYVNDADTCTALNQQRHEETAIRYTTAAANPTQCKIELLAALGKGKPVLVFLASADKRVSAMGRNVLAAIDMLEPSRKALVKVVVHGWALFESPFILEAIKCAQDGKTIDEACEACDRLATYNFCFSNFVTSATVRKLLAFKPGWFPEGFSVEENSFAAFGVPVTIRKDIIDEATRIGMVMTVQSQAPSLSELMDAEVTRIENDLKPDERITTVLVQTVGRPDYGHRYVEKLKEAGVPMSEDAVVSVYSGSMISLAMSNWGEFSAQYIVEKVTDAQ